MRFVRNRARVRNQDEFQLFCFAANQDTHRPVGTVELNAALARLKGEG